MMAEFTARQSAAMYETLKALAEDKGRFSFSEEFPKTAGFIVQLLAEIDAA
jgi:hypothetical protein